MLIRFQRLLQFHTNEKGKIWYQNLSVGQTKNAAGKNLVNLKKMQDATSETFCRVSVLKPTGTYYEREIIIVNKSAFISEGREPTLRNPVSVDAFTFTDLW